MSALKVRDRASFEFAVVSAAVALEMDGDRIRRAHVALGGVGTKPWRVPQLEAALAGESLDPTSLRHAGGRRKALIDFEMRVGAESSPRPCAPAFFDERRS